MNEYLKSGDFAQICGTTKETLRHYQDINLLNPSFVADNGYKMYSVGQVTDFLLIDSLQRAGCTLREIKEYFSTPSTSELKEVLEQRITCIENEREELLRSQRFLRNTLSGINEVGTWPDEETFKIEECAEEYFIETRVHFVADEEDELLEAIFEHLQYCREKGHIEEVQHISGIEKQSFLSGDYRSGLFFASRISEKIDSERLKIKPQGTYVKWLRTLNLSSDNIAENDFIFGEYNKLRRYLDASGFSVIGDLYEREVTFYSGDLSETLYSEISIQIAL